MANTLRWEAGSVTAGTPGQEILLRVIRFRFGLRVRGLRRHSGRRERSYEGLARRWSCDSFIIHTRAGAFIHPRSHFIRAVRAPHGHPDPVRLRRGREGSPRRHIQGRARQAGLIHGLRDSEHARWRPLTAARGRRPQRDRVNHSPRREGGRLAATRQSRPPSPFVPPPDKNNA